MEQKSNAFLETEKLSTLMRKYSLPCIISLVVAALYNIVDQIFIANADYLGSYGNAANTVVFPLTVVALAIAVMIGDGACAFVSISLGADRKDDAHRSIGNAIVLCLGSSVLLTVVYLLAMEPILTFFGGKVNTPRSITRKLTEESIRENRWFLRSHNLPESRLKEMDRALRHHFAVLATCG